MSVDESVKHFENCIVYSLGDSSIILENVCDFPIDLRAIEIEYYIYISHANTSQLTEHVELGHFRKRVLERISVEQVLQPNTALNIYFGIVRNIEDIYAIIKIDNKEYKVKVLKKKQSK